MSENGNGQNGNGNGNGLGFTHLNPQHRAFVLAYVANRGNATQAARDAGYKGDDDTLAVQGCRLLRNAKVFDAIEEVLEAQGLSPGQVSAGWAEIAKSPGPSVCFDEHGIIRWNLVAENSHLIEEISYNKGGGFRVKMYSRQRALDAAARALGMFRDRVEHTGAGGGPIETKNVGISEEERIASASAFLDAIATRGDA